MYFSLFDVLLLIGITQGVIAGVLLLFGKQRKRGDVYLALAIFTFCLLFLKIIFNYSGLAGSPTYRYLPNAFELSTAPLFYFYFRALTEKEFSFDKSAALHFVPFIAAQAYAWFVYLHVFQVPTTDQMDQIAHTLNYRQIKEVEDWAIVISILSYLFLGYRKYLSFQKQVQDNTADSAYPTLRWVSSILWLCIVLIILLLVNMLISRLTLVEQSTELHWKLYFIYQAAVTYYLGFMAYRQPELDLNQIYPVDPSSVLNTDIATPEETAIATRLIALLKVESLYLEPGLNVSQVAEKLDVTPATLSQVINSYFEKSFRNLINDYRIEDVKKKLLDPDNKASVLSLALESGFNSEASFYRVFKNSTGLNPKAFIKQARSE